MTQLARPDDQTIVIFGASGDLTARKLVPALYALHTDGLLPAEWKVVGYSRTEMSEQEFRERMRGGIPDADTETWRSFAARLHYVPGAFDSAHAMDHLNDELAARDAPSRRLLYCATPPSAYTQIIERVGECGLHEGSSIVIEKPFGRDLTSARELNEAVHRVFDEPQVFRIDHYLGKETVMNILVFRFANGMFEPTWNRRYVTGVEVTVAEDVGVGHRGGFYEEAGAIRDIVQNHIFQVLTFLAMEPPVSFRPEALRDEKAKLLSAVRRVDPDDVVRGQYEAAGDVRGYREERGVPRDSGTETYVAMRIGIDNWRWAGVPFVIRTGKRLPRRVTEVTLAFHDAPHALFEGDRPEANHLTIRIQPEEGICLTFDAKVPGPQMRTTPVDMNFSYARHFASDPPEAYQRLLHDAMLGDHTLFPRSDEVELAWGALDDVLAKPPPLHGYPAGSWGPAAADALLDGRTWHVS